MSPINDVREGCRATFITLHEPHHLFWDMEIADASSVVDELGNINDAVMQGVYYYGSDFTN